MQSRLVQDLRTIGLGLEPGDVDLLPFDVARGPHTRLPTGGCCCHVGGLERNERCAGNAASNRADSCARHGGHCSTEHEVVATAVTGTYDEATDKTDSATCDSAN